jgi:hypothetical protein
LDELVIIDTANSPFRFAVAATFTAEPLRPVIAFWSKQLNANFEIRFAPYNQLAQTLLDPASELGSNTHGVNIVLARLEDLGRLDGEDSPDALEKLESNVQAVLEQIRTAAPALNAPVIVCLCPSSPAFLDTPAGHAGAPCLQKAHDVRAVGGAGRNSRRTASTLRTDRPVVSRRCPA